MAYDEELAERIRDLLEGRPGVTEQRMFGGLAFLVDGHMTISASGQGGALVRVNPGDEAALVESTAAEPADMGGRHMAGWLRVPSAALGHDEELAGWIARATAYVAGLPPKRARAGRGTSLAPPRVPRR